MELYVDDDGYICFRDGEIFWTLHKNGWEAYLPDAELPCHYTWNVTLPTDDEMGEVQEIYEEWLKLQKGEK